MRNVLEFAPQLETSLTPPHQPPRLPRLASPRLASPDTFFLTNAVMDMEDFLTTTTEPASDAEVVVGTHKGRGFAHCFRGYEYDADGQPLPNSLTRLMYLQAFVPKMADHFASTAPEGSDVTSWRY